MIRRSKVKFERLRTSENKLYYKAMELYKISFPFHEQRKSSLQAEILKNKEYQFNIILCWETDNFIYVEHFCIFPEMRNNRYGQRALELLNKKGKTIILEIDLPIDEISIYRKAFYERVKYKTNNYEHIHPPYHEKFNGHNLIVMSYPEKLSKMEYDKFNHYLRNNVMSF